MVLTIMSEMFLVIILLFVGHSFWALVKRDYLFRSMISDEANLETLISLDEIQSLLSSDSLYLQKSELGYSINIASLVKSDKASMRNLKLVFGAVAILTLIASNYLGKIFILSNILIFSLLYLLPLRGPAHRNVLNQVLILAAILYKWHKEDEKGCNEWIESAWSLKKVYEVVKKVAAGQKTGEKRRRKKSSAGKSVSDSMLRWKVDEDFIKAAEHGDLPLVSRLVADGASVNTKNELGTTVLMLASNNGNCDLVKVLLAEGAEVNAKNNDGSTALTFASVEGHVEVVRVLLDNDANVNAQDNSGWSPLTVASQNGHREAVQALLAKGAEVNANNKNGTTALMRASQNGHLEVVRALLDNGANVNAQGKDGTTALIFASLEGHKDIVQVLLRKGAGVNAENQKGITALMAASAEGHNQVVKVLLAKGADIYAKSKDGVTAFMFAVNNGHGEIRELLRKAGAK